MKLDFSVKGRGLEGKILRKGRGGTESTGGQRHQTSVHQTSMDRKERDLVVVLIRDKAYREGQRKILKSLLYIMNGIPL